LDQGVNRRNKKWGPIEKLTNYEWGLPEKRPGLHELFCSSFQVKAHLFNIF